MQHRSRSIKLYNVLFPVWMLLLFPQMWLIVLPGNFLIDSLVLIIGMYALKTADKKQCYKQHILKIFAFGLASDFVGAAFLLLMAVLEISTFGDEWYFTVPAMLVSAALIYVFNYFVTFKHSEAQFRRKMALTFAIATAPYTFLIPTSWIY